MSILITSDTHLTDRPIDDYRWNLFPWIEEQIPKYNINALLILGDITDQKDKHSAYLTNKIADTFTNLAAKLPDGIICLRGNHDYIEPTTPFFRFLNSIPKVQFLTTVYETGLDNHIKALFLPNSRNPDEEWSKYYTDDEYDFIFMHQTVTGSESESGVKLNGVDVSCFDRLKGQILSGDVHLPQACGRVIYVGSPYRVHFNDSYTPRLILINDHKQLKDLHFKTTLRMTVDLPDSKYLSSMEFEPGTQMKVRLNLSETDILDWEKHKKEVVRVCKEKGVELFDCRLVRPETIESHIKAQAMLSDQSPEQIFNRYCDAYKIEPRLKEYGHRILS